ncbi:unnamed protein product, partial [Pneumocystis jirovecii]
MTSKKYIDFEKLNEPTFNAYLFANTLVKETHHYSDSKIDLEIPLKKLQYDIEEINEKIQEEIKKNYEEIIEYVKSSKEVANENISSIKRYTESLVDSFQRMDEKWTKKYEEAVYLLTSLQNMHTTNQLLLKVQEAVILIQRLEHLYQKIEKHNNDIESWRNCVRIAIVIYEWKDDILIVEKYKPFVTSFSEKLESMAYDMLFVQKNLSKSLLVPVISTYFLINENSLVSNLKKYNEKCIRNAVDYFYKSIEVKPILKRLSTTDPVKAKTTLLTNIEKKWADIGNISGHIYVLSIALEEPVPSLLRETFLTHQNTILSNILEKLNNQTPFEYFWKVEDKTFGLKNKNKSSKVQAQIRQIESQAAQIGKNKATKEKEAQKKEQAERKLAEESKKIELAELFKQPAQKVPFGVDPKSILCQYYKQGFCDKGFKKLHNLDVEKKSEKKDIYTDSRQIPLNLDNSYADRKDDTIDMWDDEKLQSVVLSKHGNPKVMMAIIVNINIGMLFCIFQGNLFKKHSLPPGFVFKSKQKEKEEEEITLEQFLEIERHKLGPNLTPVTLETFTEWKRKREEKKEQEEQEIRKKKEASIAAGRIVGLSGRELFEYNPAMCEEEDEILDL